MMSALVQAVQILSGLLWLLPAVYLCRRIPAALRPDATRLDAVSVRNAAVSWLMVGFSLRWLLWSKAITAMERTELTAWASLYALSCICAVWFLRDALNIGKAR